MAINKNFVIKNGVEVNTNLIVGDSETNKVGIATTVPGYTLHVGVGAGSRGGIGATDLTVTGVGTIAALAVSGISTFTGLVNVDGGITANSAIVEDLTEDRVVIAGAGGELEDSGNLTFDGDELQVGIASIWAGTGNVAIAGILTVGGSSITMGGTSIVDSNFKLQNIESLDATTTTTIENAIASGPNIFTDLEVTGLSTFVGLGTFESGVWVAGIGTFENDVHFHGNAGITTLTWDKSENALVFNDDAAIRVGTGSDLAIYHMGDNSYIRETGTGALRIDSSAVQIRNAAGTQTQATFTESGSVDLYYANAKKVETTADGILVGSLSTIQGNGNAAFAGIVTVGGNLYVKGDITYDEVTGRNLNITGITTLADQVNFGTSGIAATIYSNGNATFSGITTAKAADLQTGPLNVGTAATISANGNATFSGIVTATVLQASATGGLNGRLIGIHTSADGGGVGIASTTAHVGYGFTYLDLKGPGVSTVFASAVTGIATIYFQGGGGSSVGAAGTWQNDGDSGISTVKTVGINTVGIAITALQGGGDASVAMGNTANGLYIGNGMLIVDNQLNGNHYIGTAFNGIMGGPVTVNGVLTVDGNWVVV